MRAALFGLGFFIIDAAMVMKFGTAQQTVYTTGTMRFLVVLFFIFAFMDVVDFVRGK